MDHFFHWFTTTWPLNYCTMLMISTICEVAVVHCVQPHSLWLFNKRLYPFNILAVWWSTCTLMMNYMFVSMYAFWLCVLHQFMRKCIDCLYVYLVLYLELLFAGHHYSVVYCCLMDDWLYGVVRNSCLFNIFQLFIPIACRSGFREIQQIHCTSSVW